LEGSGRGLSERTYPGIKLQMQREILKTSFRITAEPVSIKTGYLHEIRWAVR